MLVNKVYVGRRRSHLGDRITVYSLLDADGVRRGTEIVMEAEFDQPSHREPLVLALDEPVLEKGLIYK